MSAGPGAGLERRGPVMKVAASSAARANAAAQIQLIWPKLDRNCTGQGVRGGVHRAGGQGWQEGRQAKAEQQGQREYGRPVAGVEADAHAEHGRSRAQQAARD